MTDLGDVSYYLGMQVNHVIGEKITLCQSTYLRKVLNCFKMTVCKLALVPMNPEVPNSLVSFDGNADKKIIKWYQSAIKCLIWPAVHTRPDIAYLIGVFSCYYSNPGPIHCNLIIQIFKYLSGTFDLGIVFIANSKDDLVS